MVFINGETRIVNFLANRNAAAGTRGPIRQIIMTLVKDFSVNAREPRVISSMLSVALIPAIGTLLSTVAKRRAG